MFEELRDIKGQAQVERWELSRPFKIARGVRAHGELVVVKLNALGSTGRGESCPTDHYGESVESVMAQVTGMLSAIEEGGSWSDLHDAFPAGAARNAVDCAMWDLLAKVKGGPVWQYAGAKPFAPVETVFTISLDEPEVMAKQAAGVKGHNILKVKLGAGDGDDMRIKAVRNAVPDVRLIIDANEGWTREQLVKYLPVMADQGVEMVEQPLPASKNADMQGIERLVPLGADESCHVSSDVADLVGLFDVVNIKLDKTGGLTEALRLLEAAQKADFDIMVGCMLGTSLAMAPGMLVANQCKFVDLDAPLLIGDDRTPALKYENGIIQPPKPELWG